MVDSVVVDTRALNSLARSNPANMAEGLNLLLRSGYDIYVPQQVVDEILRAGGAISQAQLTWIDENRALDRVKSPPAGFTFVGDPLKSQVGDEAVKQLTQYINNHGGSATFLTDDVRLFNGVNNLSDSAALRQGYKQKPFAGTPEFLNEMLVKNQITETEFRSARDAISAQPNYSGRFVQEFLSDESIAKIPSGGLGNVRLRGGIVGGLLGAVGVLADPIELIIGIAHASDLRNQGRKQEGYRDLAGTIGSIIGGAGGGALGSAGGPLGTVGGGVAGSLAGDALFKSAYDAYPDAFDAVFDTAFGAADHVSDAFNRVGDFAADMFRDGQVTVDNFSGTASAVVRFDATGRFLPAEHVPNYGQLFGTNNGTVANIQAAMQALDRTYNSIRNPGVTISIEIPGYGGTDAVIGNVQSLTTTPTLDASHTAQLLSNGATSYYDSGLASNVTARLMGVIGSDQIVGFYKGNETAPYRVTPLVPMQVPDGQNGEQVISKVANATAGLPNPNGAATGTTDNSNFNLVLDTQSGAPGNQPILNEGEMPWLNGLIYRSGTYQVTMNPNVLNGDGLFNVGPSLIAADSWRPGGQHLAPDTNLFINNENILTRGWSPTSTSSATNLLMGSNRIFLNIDPFVVDLDGDGVELRPFDAMNVLFNVDSDAHKERTGWIKGDDGFLVRDINGNGKIDDIKEIMSDYYNGRTPDGAAAVDVLRTLDSNADGKFTSADSQWSSFRIWQDANENGETDAGELKTFASLGITGFDLTKTSTIGLIRGGADVLARHDVIMSDGSRREALSVEFVTDPFGAIIEAFGSNYKATFQSFDGASDFKALIAGSSALTVGLLGSNPEGFRHVYGGDGADVITGDANDNWIIGGKGADTLRGAGGNDFLIFDAEDVLVYGGPGFDIAQAVGSKGVVLNLTQSAIEVAIGSSGSDILIGGGNSNVFIAGGKGADFIYGGGADDVLSGEDGDDLIEGMAGDDLIRGHRGQDLIRGGQGNDMLYGGDDNDVLIGADGDDLLSGGSGDDALSGGAGTDTAEFSGDMQDYSFTKVGAEWIIRDLREGSPDGTDRLDTIERLNFRNLKDVAFDLVNPLPVNDLINVAASGPYTIAASTLLGNDIDLQGGALSITSVLNPVGGTVAISGSNVIFTPTAGSGFMSFQYKIKDAQNNPGALIGIIGDPGAGTAEAKGTVFLRTPDMPLDPLLRDQWYVNEIDLLKVWKDYSGHGVNIAVTDPGNFDPLHVDLDDNFGTAWREDGSGGVRDTTTHATMVAGVIGAERNGVGSVGVAYGATLNSIAVPQTSGGDLSNMLLWKNYDIVNNSWGFSNRYGANFLVDTGIASAFAQTAAYGRGGLGTVNIFAAGNLRADGGNANDANVTNSRYAIAVGAVNHRGDLGALVIGTNPFSSPGANILVSAPGSNISSTGRLVQNPQGSTFGDDYETAQGTSLATPIVSGVVALMLEANPTLGYRDVQDILALAAKRVDDSNPGWAWNGAKNWNGGAMHINHDYGFGEIDARAAVRLAETWTTSHVLTDSNPSTYDLYTQTLSSGTLNAAVTDNGTITRSLSVSAGLLVEHAEVRLQLDHQQIGDLVVTLISPSGTRSVLMNRPGKTPGSTDATDRGDGATNLDYVFMTALSRGEAGGGTWTIEVKDAASGQTGTLKSWELTLTGKAGEANETFVYTDEFATLGTGTRATLTASGGSDAINASAVSTAMTINLTPGSTSTIAGKSLLLASTSTSVVNAFGGDGNDTITGSAGANLLYGGRGNDTLNGGNGDDILVGGAGADRLNGGAGIDTAHYYATGTAGVTVNLALTTAQTGGEAQGDILNSIENVNGTRFNDVLTGNGSANILVGYEGDDTLAGGLGPDTLVGDEGFDTVTYAASNAAVTVSMVTFNNLGGHAAGDQLYGIERVIGSNYDDNFQTGADAMTWVGGQGSDLLVIGVGAERFEAGAGMDVVDLALSNAAVTFDMVTGIASGGYATGDVYLDVENVYSTAYGDTLKGNAAENYFLLWSGVDHIDGRGGYDVVSYAASTSGVTVSLTTSAGSTGDAAGDTFVNVEDITGSNYADTITGDGGDNVLAGLAGNDRLIGGGGYDLLFGGEGTDTAVFSRVRSAYALSTGSDTNGAFTDVLENSTGVVDRLYQIELIEFTDQTVSAPAGAMLRTSLGQPQALSRSLPREAIDPEMVANRLAISGARSQAQDEIQQGPQANDSVAHQPETPTANMQPPSNATGVAQAEAASGYLGETASIDTGADASANDEADKAAERLAQQEESTWGSELPTLGGSTSSGWWREDGRQRPRRELLAAGDLAGEPGTLQELVNMPSVSDRQRLLQAMAAFRGDAGAAPAIWRRQTGETTDAITATPAWKVDSLDRAGRFAA